MHASSSSAQKYVTPTANREMNYVLQLNTGLSAQKYRGSGGVGLSVSPTGFLLQQLDLLFQVLDDLVGLRRPLLQPQQRIGT